MFSNSTKYAIKAVLYLAVHSSEQHKIVINDIAEPINVPKAYLAKLLQELSRQSIISSTKGLKGGFYLSNKDRERNIKDIIDVIDGEDRLNSCLLSLKDCDSKNPCSLHHLAYSQKQIILDNFKSKSLNDLAMHLKSGKSVLPL
ncbi:MAG: Rrf2 family transcriptional regulator [Winogradskyella sp.]|uniref:RrF2 family transcriptional regulator n=1 Tax=Winogradskyella sp. TaxID=1883156 RepID=UPI00182C7E12|nr:Rrf2 family transcriptional regulator [Winogradskyella sp.]MBT8245701.1 Rrf2 family transcriptional regulator [Winogradskyella sp.]NNK21757.1 Rrf2 family transcriptional regulator [Winogradskyella sp.]